MKLIKLILTILLITAIQPFAQATGPAWCKGKIKQYNVAANGEVMIAADFRGSFFSVCNLNIDRQGVSPTTCAAWMVTIKAAMSTSSSLYIGMYYADIESCATIPLYDQAPAPASVMLLQ